MTIKKKLRDIRPGGEKRKALLVSGIKEVLGQSTQYGGHRAQLETAGCDGDAQYLDASDQS